MSVSSENSLGSFPQKTQARLHDGSLIAIEIHGQGPDLLLPVNPTPVEGPQAEAMRQYGADPALGQSLIQGLRDRFRVIAFDYEGHVLRVPKPDTLTPDNVAADLLAVADAAAADAAGAERFVYYGYSWLAVVGLQLAIRTDRLAALVMGGYPPIHGPYEEMLRVTHASHALAAGEVTLEAGEADEWAGTALSADQTRQFVTLYEALRGFDDVAAQARITCPRICFVGSKDEIRYGKQWGDVLVSLAGPVMRWKDDLTALGWNVRVLEGHDHISAMQAAQVLPILRSLVIAGEGEQSRK